MTGRYFLGVDIGNSKSHAVITDEAGRHVGAGEAGPGSWEAIGWDGARHVIHEIVSRALDEAGIVSQQIASAGFGLAGYDWPEDRQGYVEIVESLELGGPYELVNDGLIGLYIGAAGGWGVCISAGTSCNCYGVDGSGKLGRVTGHSRLFGEYAGASEIVAQALQAVGREWSLRGPATRLSDAFIELTGADSLDDLLAGLTRHRYRISAADAPLIFAAADSGDAVSQEIVQWAGSELGGLAVGVIRQLGLEAASFEVVMTGSVYDHNESMWKATETTIHRVAPGAKLIGLRARPVLGGIILSMKLLGLDATAARIRLLEASNHMFG